MAIVDGVAPYAQFRQARLLGWHPTERRLLISTAFGNVTQVHEVRAPGGARTQLTFFRDGVTGGASYEPGGRYVVFRKDTSGGGEAMQLFRYDLDSGRITLLTDGKSRHGVPVWSHRRGLVAFSSTRRNGKDRDLWMMDPLEPASARMIAEVDGTWDALDWSVSDKEVLAQQLIAGSTETRLWRIDVDSGRRVLVTPQGGSPARWSDPAGPLGTVQRRRTRSVYALSDRDSEVTRVWRGDLATGKWRPLTGEGVAIEAFAVAPVGTVVARRRRSRRDERAAVHRRGRRRRRARFRRSRLESSPTWPGTVRARRSRSSSPGPGPSAMSTPWTSRPAGSSAGPRARWAAPVRTHCRTRSSSSGRASTAA